MSKHTQPTAEELAERQKNIEADLEELAKKHEAGETVDDPDEENKDPNEKKSDDDQDDSSDSDADDKSGDEESGDKDNSDKDVKQIKKSEDDSDDAGDDTDVGPSIEERYKNSTQEAQILNAKTKKMADAFKQVKNVPDPTDEDMTKEYGDSWEDMSDFEKKLAIKDWKNDRRFEAINQIAEDTENAEAWSEKVDGFIDDPETLQKNPKLEGKVEAFKLFANKQTRRGVDFEDLTKAFLFEVDSTKPAKKKGKMFEIGSGGDNKKVDNKPKKLSIEQSKALKKTNYNAWKEALMNDQIEDEF